MATSGILESCSEITDVFENAAEDQSQKGETVQEAENTSCKMQEMEFMFKHWPCGMLVYDTYCTSPALQEKV